MKVMPKIPLVVIYFITFRTFIKVRETNLSPLEEYLVCMPTKSLIEFLNWRNRTHRTAKSDKQIARLNWPVPRFPRGLRCSSCRWHSLLRSGLTIRPSGAAWSDPCGSGSPRSCARHLLKKNVFYFLTGSLSCPFLMI